jgi:hypothetical protein
MAMTPKPKIRAHPVPALAELRYLEQVIDFEGGIDRGPLAGKDLLVYAPEKTGSVSLFNGLLGFLARTQAWSEANRRMLHNHSNRQIVQNLKLYSDAPSKEQLVARAIVLDLIDYRSLNSGDLLIVSSYREPLTRTLSLLFHHLENAIARGDLDLESLTADRCADELAGWLGRAIEQFKHPLTEIEPDFFRSNLFDRSTHSCFVQRDHYRILSLTLPYADAWGPACERHLGFPDIQFGHRNRGDQKSLAGLYGRVRSELRLSSPLIRRLYLDSADTECLRWFFSASEVEAMCAKAMRDYGQAPAKRSLSAWLPRSLRRQPLPFLSRPVLRATIIDLSSRLSADECRTQKRIIVTVRLENTGKHELASFGSSAHQVVAALRARRAGGLTLTSDWQKLPRPIPPGSDVECCIAFDIPTSAAELDWCFDLIYVDHYWFSDKRLLRGDRRCRAQVDRTGGAAWTHPKRELQFVYLHIPKTAGSSVTERIGHAYGAQNVLHVCPRENDSMHELLHPDRIRRYAALRGHLSRRDFIFGNGILFSALVRAPVARALSLYAWYMRPDLVDSSLDASEQRQRRVQQRRVWEPRGMHPQSIVKSLQDCPQFRREVENVQCRYLSYCEPTFDGAIETLRRDAFVVGCLEQLPKYLAYMTDLLGWGNAALGQIKASRSGYAELLAEQGLVEAITEFTREDAKLFAFVHDECNGLFAHVPDERLVRGSRLDVRDQEARRCGC